MEQLKVDLINDAYSKIRISGLTVIPSPNDLELSLTRLENIMNELQDARGWSLGYNFEDDPDPNSYSNLPRSMSEGISSLLATRLIPDFNKIVPPQLMAMCSASLSGISGIVARNKMQQFNYPHRMPVGSGNFLWSRWARFYYPAPIVPLDSIEMLVGDINNYIFTFEQYLNDGEVIQSFTSDISDGLTINSSAIVGNTINYSLTATNDGLKTLKITITTDTGRVNIKPISINVTKPPEAN
jgi:hypothetical protein